MPKVYYYKNVTFPNGTYQTDSNCYVDISGLDFSAPSGYSLEGARVTGTVSLGNPGVSGTYRIEFIAGNSHYAQGNYYVNSTNFSPGQTQALRDVLVTTSEAKARSSYAYGNTGAYKICMHWECPTRASYSWSNLVFTLVFSKTISGVSVGDKITKAQFDAMGWSATVGSAISHSGFGGIIYASTYNNAAGSGGSSTISGSMW